MQFNLKLPLSSNQLYRVCIQEQIKQKHQYYEECRQMIKDQLGDFQTIKGNVQVDIRLELPNNRDIDNYFKCLLGCIQYFGIIENDRQVVKLSAEKKVVSYKEQIVRVQITPL